MPPARDTADGNPLGAPSENVLSVPPLLEMRGIVRRFGATVALAGVDFAARAGEIHALLGENGAGKSTLMHILSGLLRPDAGEIRLRGEAVRVETPRAARALGIAMVHQHFTLVPAFTVAENLALDAPPPSGATALRYASLTAAEPALERAAALGWPLPAEARIAELAVGTQQRVEIVKALATDAELLIFDEPTAVLAGNEIEELFTVLRRLKAQGKAVLLIAHKLAEILAVADRVTVLRRGHRVASCLASETDARQLAVWMVGGDLPLSDLAPPASPPSNSAAREGRKEAGQPPSPLPGEEQAIQGAGARVRGQAPTSPPPLARNERSGKGGGRLGQIAFCAADLVVRGDRGEEAVRGLSLAVGREEIFGIGGVDGNGQTELAEALVGLRPLVSGTMTWEGEPFQPGKRPSLGYIPPDRRRTGLATTMTIAENLALDAARSPAFRWGPFLRRRALKQLSEMLVRQFDVRTENANLPAASLSGGNQQKVVVARALYGQPDWIVAVNPTRGLDLHATRFVHDRLREARARGAAIVLISTDLDELSLLADRAAILSGGQLREVALERAGTEELGLLLGGEAAA